MRHITCPTLVMGLAGGYEYLAAEPIYLNSPEKDKEIAFVEGTSHMLWPAKECEQYPGQFGDTITTLFNHVDKWLAKRYL